MFNNKLKNIITFILIICVLLSLSSCRSGGIFERISESKELPQPNPYDGISYMTRVPLYYRFMDSEYLLPVMREIKMHSNEMPEAAVLRALISGVGTDDVYTSVIPPSTELVNMVLNGEILFVTLNSAFTDSKNYNDEYEKSIAVCEILNTLTKSSSYSVQILIDSNNTGIGEVVSYEDLGFDEGYDRDNDYFPAALFTNSIVATPQAEFLYAMEALKNGDYKKAAYLFVDEQNKTDITAQKLLSFFEYRVILSYDIDSSRNVSGTTVISFNLKYKDNVTKESVSLSDLSLTLTKTGELYKIDLNRFISLLEGKA